MGEGQTGGGKAGTPALTRRVRLNIAFKFASEVSGKLLALVMTGALARGLGPSAFGVYVFGFTAGLMLGQVCDFGMQLFAAREVAGGRQDAPRLVGNLLLVRGALGAFGLAVLTGLSGLAGFSGDERAAVCVLAATAVVTSFGEFAFYVFRGRQEVRFEAALSVTQRALGLGTTLAALRLGWGIAPVSWGLFFASAVSVAAAYGVLTQRYFRPVMALDRPLLREAFRQVLPIGMAITLSAVCFRADVIILKALRGIGEVGVYGAGRRLMEPLALLPAALMAGVFPAFSALPPGDPGRPGLVRKTTLLLLATSLPLAILAALFRTPILSLVYGPGYAAAGPPFVILMATLVPMFLTYGFTHFLIALGLARLNAAFFGVGLVVNLASNLVLVPSLGATGAAISLLITEGVLMTLCGLTLLKIPK